MPKYFIMFYQDSKPVCSCYQSAAGEDMAEFQAVVSLMCFASNIAWNRCTVEEVKEG